MTGTNSLGAPRCMVGRRNVFWKAAILWTSSVIMQPAVEAAEQAMIGAERNMDVDETRTGRTMFAEKAHPGAGNFAGRRRPLATSRHQRPARGKGIADRVVAQLGEMRRQVDLGRQFAPLATRSLTHRPAHCSCEGAGVGRPPAPSSWQADATNLCDSSNSGQNDSIYMKSSRKAVETGSRRLDFADLHPGRAAALSARCLSGRKELPARES